MSAAPMAVPNLVQIRPWGASGQMGEIIKKNLFIPFFGNSSTGQTRRRIFTLDGSNDSDSGLAQGCAFSLCVIHQ